MRLRAKDNHGRATVVMEAAGVLFLAAAPTLLDRDPQRCTRWKSSRVLALKLSLFARSIFSLPPLCCDDDDDELTSCSPHCPFCVDTRNLLPPPLGARPPALPTLDRVSSCTLVDLGFRPSDREYEFAAAAPTFSRTGRSLSCQHGPWLMSLG